MIDVVIGAWREGLTKQRSEDIKAISERGNQGFRLAPFEATILELSMALDAYDVFLDDLYVDCDCDCCAELAEHVCGTDMVVVNASILTPEQQKKSKK
jgi:hypothetical protein